MLEPNFVAATMLRNANKFAEAYSRALQSLCLETGLHASYECLLFWPTIPRIIPPRTSASAGA